MGEYMRYILLILVLLVSSFSFAQENSESVDSANIEEVVTSALRKETALQDTGLAVTVISATDIESKNLKEFYDFQFNVPGVLFNKTNFSGAGIQIRGMTNYAVGGSFSAVATPRQDDINMGTLQMAQNELFDLASFEVLRGPQGTLYGGNNPGGTFLMKSVDPGDEVDAYFKAEFGDKNLERYSGGMTFGAGERMRTRFSFRSTHRDGYTENLFDDSDIDDRDYLGVRMKTIYDISDDTSLKLTMMHNEESDSRLRHQNAACNENKLLGCDQWGDGLPGRGTSHSGVSAFGSIDFIVLNYPGNIVQPVLALGYQDDAIIPTDPNQVFQTLNPVLERYDTSASLVLDHMITDEYQMFMTFAYIDQEYDHSQSLNGYASTRPYRMGPIQANIFGAERNYTTTEEADASLSNYTQKEFELRIASDLDGRTNGTGGIYFSNSDSLTNYRVTSPGMQYYSDVSKGPIGGMFPDLGGYGGLGFWATYFTTYGGVAVDNITNGVVSAAIDYVTNDPTTPAQIAALIPQLLAAGQCTDPATDCAQLAQQVLVGNAAQLPQIVGAGTVAGVAQSHNDAANQVRALASLPISTVLALGAIPILPALPEWQQQFQSYNSSENETFGLFVETVTELPENRWFDNLTLGGRFNRITQSDKVFSGITDISQSLAGYNGTLQGFPNPPLQSVDLEEFTGRAILDKKLDGERFSILDGTLLYLKADRGIKSGGFNPTSNLLPGENQSLVDAEIHNIFEVGTKGTYMGGALTLNTAAFWNSVTGMQLNKIIGLASQTFNSDVDISGFEIEALFAPNMWSRFNFVGALNTSELAGYEDYDPRNPYGITSVDASTIGESQGVVFGMTDVGMIYRSLGSTCNQPFNALVGPACPNTGFVIQDLTGRKLPGVPDLSFSLGGEVDLMNNENGLLTARLDYIYRGDFYLTVFNNDHELVDEFDFMNFDLTYQTPDGKWMVDLYVHNIEDKDIVTGGFVGSQSNGGGYNLYFQEPMNGGISIQYNF